MNEIKQSGEVFEAKGAQGSKRRKGRMDRWCVDKGAVACETSLSNLSLRSKSILGLHISPTKVVRFAPKNRIQLKTIKKISTKNNNIFVLITFLEKNNNIFSKMNKKKIVLRN